MEAIVDFIIYMFYSIKNEEIDASNLSAKRKRIKKLLLFSLIILISIAFFIFLDKINN